MVHSSSPVTYRMRNDDMDSTWCFLRENNQCMPHFHLCAEVHYVLEGSVTAIIDGEQIEVRQHEMAVVSSYSIHHFFTPVHSRVIVAVIPLPFVPAVYERLRQQIFRVRLWRQPSPAAVDMLLHLQALVSIAGKETIQGLSQALLGMLIDEIGIQPTQPNLSCEAMRRIIEYMQAHFAEALTVGGVAAHFNYSRSRLCHLFQSQLHSTFTLYLSRLRCRQAAILLRDKNRSATDIAFEVGFQSVRTFYRVFGQIYRLPPLEYAKSLSKNPTAPSEG